MKNWITSRYTCAFSNENGELLLHNSYMGALALIPSDLASIVIKYLKNGFNTTEQKTNIIKELCSKGFFIPSDINEVKIVQQILNAERNLKFNLIVLPHENCNFRCTYCYETFERGHIEPKVITGLKKFVKYKSKDIRTMSVSWFGGEPLLARNIIYELSNSFQESCNIHSTKYESRITTNGYLLDSKTVTELLRSKIKKYQITLDGPEELHNQARKLAGDAGKNKGTYKKILYNLKSMTKIKDDFSVTIRVNFTKKHTPDLIEPFLYKMQQYFGNDSRFHIKFNPVSQWGKKKNNNICSIYQSNRLEQIFRKKSEELGLIPKIKETPACLVSHGAVCFASRDSSIIVGADGTIYKCTIAFQDPINQVGQLMPDGQLKINETRWQRWTKLDNKDTNKCTSCSYNPICQSCSCPLRMIYNGKPDCPISIEEYQNIVSRTVMSLKNTSNLTYWKLLEFNKIKQNIPSIRYK